MIFNAKGDIYLSTLKNNTGDIVKIVKKFLIVIIIPMLAL